MTDLQKEFEATGYASWINADLYPDGKIYTQEYTRWLEEQVLALHQPPVSGCRQGDLCIICGDEVDSDYGSVCSDCDDSHLDDWC